MSESTLATPSRHCIAFAALFLLSAGEAGAAAARVDFAYGNVTVSGADGREQPLVRGAELDNGDTVRTADGRAQLRFADGAYVSLQPNSEFAIRDYRFDGKTDGSERGFFGLAKGAMRTVTGLIGRVNRDSYRVTTPTATIGIRGTGGVIQVLNDGSTLIVGTSGIWSLANPAGSVDVPAGVSALSPSTPDAPPQQTSQAPQAGPAPLTLPMAFAQGERRDVDANLTSNPAIPPSIPPTVPPPPPTTVPGYQAVFLYGAGAGIFPNFDARSDALAGFDSSGQLVQADVASIIYKTDGRHADFGTDGILTWGRWVGDVTVGSLVKLHPDNQGLHYVVGLPSATLPTAGTATYALAGASRPTYVNGALAPGTFSGSLSVTFGAAATIDGQFSAAMPDRTYAWTSSGTTTSATFSLATTSSSGCASTCTVNTQGFFSGTTAERVGIGYHIQDANNAAIGTAAFRKQ
jgi:hypothetical protein